MTTPGWRTAPGRGNRATAAGDRHRSRHPPGRRRPGGRPRSPYRSPPRTVEIIAPAPPLPAPTTETTDPVPQPHPREAPVR
ncbi:hypothetical protein GCM10010327_43110 [Streptomyces nitrosporeus]|nr:hypothetical protein GCM10010327_43110 [Streptomyces nitrosporeus]